MQFGAHLALPHSQSAQAKLARQEGTRVTSRGNTGVGVENIWIMGNIRAAR